MFDLNYFSRFIIKPYFLQVVFKNGHLFGSLLDILNHATPLILISLGMIIVIAAKGSISRLAQ